MIVVGVIGSFSLPKRSYAASYIAERSASQDVWLGENIQVSNYTESDGWMGWSFLKAETSILQGRDNVKTTRTHAYIKSKLDGSIYDESHATKTIGWGATSIINNSFYETPPRSVISNYYLETHHEVQDARTNKWYVFVQRKHIIYTPKLNFFYENNGGFVPSDKEQEFY